MRFLKSLHFALMGIRHCFYSEINFRIELGAALLAFLLGILLTIRPYEWVAILLCTALVLGFEIINTAIENLSNFVTLSVHPIIKVIKDMAAGAVLLASILSLITGCIIFIPKLHPLIINLHK